MNEVTSYIKLIYIVSIAAGVLMTFIPKGRLKGSFVSLCAVITVSAMVMPFSSIRADSIGDFETDMTESSDSLFDKTHQAEVQLYESAIAAATEDNLRNEGITASVSVECDEKSDSFIIKAVTVKGSFGEEELTCINSLLSGYFGEAEIIYEEVPDG